MVIEILLAALAESIIGVLADELIQHPRLTGLRDMLRGDSPEKLALQAALAEAYAAFSGKYKALAASFFDDHYVLKPEVSEELAKILTPNRKPDVTVLEQAWVLQFYNAPDLNIRPAIEFFLLELSEDVKAQPALKPFVDSEAFQQLYIIAEGSRGQVELQTEIVGLLRSIDGQIALDQSRRVIVPTSTYLPPSLIHWYERGSSTGGGDSLDKEVELACDGFVALVRLANQPVVHAAIAASSADFEAARHQISVLDTHKHLHDRLLELHICCRMVDQDVTRVDTDAAAWESITISGADLAATIDRLIESANAAVMVVEDNGWIRRVEQARTDLNNALDGRDLQVLGDGLRRVHRVLNREPTRLNKGMIDAARSMRLSSVVSALNAVVGTFSPAESPDQVSISKVATGARALEIIEQILHMRTDMHNAWQDVYDELRRIERPLRPDLEELGLSWPDLREAMHVLLGGMAERWAQDLREVSVQVEEALLERNPTTTLRAYTKFSRQVYNRFNNVDRQLLICCEKLQKVAGSFDTLIRTLT